MVAVPFDFRGITIAVCLRTGETGGHYAVVEMRHPPAVGPALHVHPRGPESFYVVEGTYTFTRGDETITARAGDAVTIPAGVPHRYVVGAEGGRAVVVMPPGLERYFERVAAQLAEGPVSLESEFAVASEHGQDFLDEEGHWSTS